MGGIVGRRGLSDGLDAFVCMSVVETKKTFVSLCMHACVSDESRSLMQSYTLP